MAVLMLPELFARISRSLTDALFPPKCLVCGSFLSPLRCEGENPSESICPDKASLGHDMGAVFRMFLGSFLCRDCRRGFASVESPMCLKCGIIFKSREGEDHSCGHCLKSPKRFRRARAAGLYDQALRKLIQGFKYKGKIQLAKPLGALLLFAFRRFWDQDEIDRLVPVPLHARRFRKRGFNQAFLLIKGWARTAEMLNLECSFPQVVRDELIRNRWTDPQTGLDRPRRMQNLRNAFSLRDASGIAGKRILLVDDVYTTGATADECARVLLAGGARYVDVLTVARTM